MKRLKRLGLIVAVTLLLGAGIMVAVAYLYGVRGTPDWLRRSTATAEEQAAAANRMDQKIIETLSYVREMNAYDAAMTPTTSASDRRPAVSQPASRLEVSFTEDELNASFHKWDELYGWTKRYQNHVQDPSIVLHDGRIILAGKSEDFGSVVSLHFTPQLDELGRLNLSLSKVQAGRLRLPESAFDKYRSTTRDRLEHALPALQRNAQLNKDGSANLEAMSAAMAKLFLRVLANEPAEPVLFLPVGHKRSVPVRLTDVKIENKTLSLTVKPLNSTERVALLDRIREHLDKETATATESVTASGRESGS